MNSYEENMCILSLCLKSCRWIDYDLLPVGYALTLRSRWRMFCWWMKSTPSQICLMKTVQAFSVNTKSSSITRSKSSPPSMLENAIHFRLLIFRYYFRACAVSWHGLIKSVNRHSVDPKYLKILWKINYFCKLMFLI